MANILESPINIEDEAFEEEIDVEREDFELVEPRYYDDMLGLPQINGVTLTGNKTSSDLGIITQEQVDNAIQTESQARSSADTELNNKINAESTARGEADTALSTRIDDEALARQQADNGLQTQIDAITSKSDVVDVVANYAALQAYDTSTLGNNDVVKVLDDETHEDALTYYRWSTTTQTWTYIGQEAPYYSKGQMDTKLAEKQDKLTAGANIQIENGTISATDTKYTAGNGLNLNDTEFSADTNVLATKEDLEGYYTKPETDNLLAPKLEAEVVAELPTTGAEGKLYLTPKAHTTQTATGNPITATVAEGAGAIESFQLDGDTYQQSYTGKNLCNPATFVKGRLDNGVLGYASNTTSLTVEGNSITYTTNASYRGIVSAYIPVEPNTKYTLSRTVTSEITVSALIDAFESDSEAGWIERLLTATFTTPNNCHYVRISFQNYASGTATISNTMVEKSATATSYEPYVGGQPSPSPDYPQPIQTVTGEQTVTVVGKNLISANWESGRYNNSTGAKEPYSDNVRTDSPIAVQPSKTYICSRNGSGLAMNILQYKADGSFISATTISSGNSFTTGADTYFVTMFRGTSGGTEGIQLELGSTITSYVPYSATSYPINLGKNLFDKNSMNIRNAYLYNNTFVLRSTYSDRVFILPCSPNTTYTISRSIKTASFRAAYSELAPTAIPEETAAVNTLTCAGTITDNNASSITITTGSTAKSLLVHYGNVAVDGVTLINQSLDTMMVEIGSQATTYAPYFTPIELCKLGDYQDYIYKDGDDWKVHKATAALTLNGKSSENWYIDQYAYMLNGVMSAKPFSDIANMEAYCKSFSKSATGQVSSYVVSFWYNAPGTGVRFIKDQTPDLSSFINWLASNNQTVYYPLATATDSTITDTTLIAQLEAIRTASLQNGTNTITNTATGSNLAGDMEIGYYGFNPRNRYDKWLWLNINNNYEQIGS